MSMFIITFSILATALLIYLLFETYNKIKTQIHTNATKKYVQVCPDYWEVVSQSLDTSGNVIGVECKNVHQLGKCAVSDRDTFKFDDHIFTDPETAELAKCKWSKRCEVSWQGIDDKC